MSEQHQLLFSSIIYDIFLAHLGINIKVILI